MVTATSADSFKGWLSEQGKKDGRGLSSRSVNNVLYFARNMFQFAENRDWVAKNVFNQVRLRKAVPVRHPDPFTPDEIRTLLMTAKDNSSMQWFYPVVLFLALTGCRRGAVPRMRVSDFDSSKCILRLRADAAKQGRAYEYAVPEVLARTLERITAGRSALEPLFIDNDGRGINSKAFDPPSQGCEGVPPCRTWYKLLLLGNVRPRGAHNLRRAVISNLAEANVTMDKIIAVTGQTIEVARQLYLRLDKQTQRSTMEFLAAIYDRPKHN